MNGGAHYTIGARQDHTHSQMMCYNDVAKGINLGPDSLVNFEMTLFHNSDGRMDVRYWLDNCTYEWIPRGLKYNTTVHLEAQLE